MLPAIISIVEEQKDARTFTTFAALLKDPESHEEYLQQIDTSKRSDYLKPERIASIEAAADERFTHFSRAYKSLGFLERGFIELMNRVRGRENFTSKPQPDFSSIELSAEDSSQQSTKAKEKTGPYIRINNPRDSKTFEVKDAIGSESVASMLNQFERFESQQGSSEPVHWFNRVRDMLIIPLCVMIVWGGIARGGLTQAVTGLAVVRRDGRRATILQCAWRTLLFWIPLFLLAAIILVFDAHGTDWVWWTQQMRRGYFLLPILYLVLVFRWPNRGPHDIASGTYVVPK